MGKIKMKLDEAAFFMRIARLYVMGLLVGAAFGATISRVSLWIAIGLLVLNEAVLMGTDGYWRVRR